jgi:Uma2 family endonuclease
VTHGGTKKPEIGQRMTLEEWANLPEDVTGELVGGRLVEDEVPDPVHERVVTWLAGVIDPWVDALGGFTLGSGAKFGPRLTRGRMCDLSVFLPGSAYPEPTGAIRAPADIMIEVISPGARNRRRDRVEKMNEYATFGARFYWLIDPKTSTFEIFALDAAKHYACVVKTSRGILDVPGCPGLRLDLDALWTRIKRFRSKAKKKVAPRPKKKVAPHPKTRVTKK